MRRLLVHRDVRILFGGETLSMFGDRAMFLVLAIWAKSLTGSNAAAGLVFFAITMPSLAAPLAGLAVDRMSRRRLMIAVDCFIGLAMLSLLFVHGRSDVWLIYLVAVLYGAAIATLTSAQSALLTVIVPEELLGDANALFQTLREGLRLVAPLAGAGLFATLGGGSVAVLDACTFGASAAALALLHVAEPPPSPREHALFAELTAGARHLWNTQALRQIVLAGAVAFLVIGFAETFIFAVIDQGLHRPPSFFGVLGAVQGAGAVLGGLTAARALRALGDVRLVGVGILMFGGGTALLTSSALGPVAAGIATSGAGLSWAIVGAGTALQRRTPPNLQGRAYSAADTLMGTPQTLSIAVGAGLSTLVDYRMLIACTATVMCGCGIYLATRRVLSAGAVADALPRSAPVDAAENVLIGPS